MTLHRKRGRSWSLAALLLIGLFAPATPLRADEPVVTTVADYEDNSVVAYISDVRNVTLADCDVSLTAIPARGQRALTVEIGATERNASVACDLRFRIATPFDQADRVATYAWITQGSVDISFRLRDSTGRIFETPPTSLRTHNRWVRLVADLTAKSLTPVGERTGPEETPVHPTWPLQVLGYRIQTHAIGRQAVHLDNLEVEHRVSGSAVLCGEFALDEPTHIYKPGSNVRAAVVLENTSRQRALPLTIRLAWLRADGSELTTARASINLPASGTDYRSRQPVDFSQRIDEPGLYRLVAQVHGPRWISPAVFETTIAATFTNRALPRGRATFFGVQTNLMREPPADRLLEIEIAREIGVQLLAIETPWRMIEPARGTFEFDVLDEVINLVTSRDIAAMIVLTDPPKWLAQPDADRLDRQAVLFEVLAGRYGKRVNAYQPLPGNVAGSGQSESDALAAAAQIRKRVAEIRPEAELVAPPILVQSGDAEHASMPTLPTDTDLQIAFETSGDSAAALAALEAFAQRNDLKWNRAHRWFHRAEALNGSGALYDAVSVLRFYVRAAAEGVGGVVWFDLRDDTSDPRRADEMKGLVQRNFSPKTPLLGFASAVGMLHGLLYTGPVSGTPTQFDSALFIGGNRQVAVLFPKPNRVLPAVLAPYAIVDGTLTVFDFDRRVRPLERSASTSLAPTPRDPLFITLDAQRAQAEPKLQLAHPWLRMPATVYCGAETTFTIEIDAPTDLRRSFLQVIMPEDTPLESSVANRALRARAGEKLSFDVTLTRAGDDLFKPSDLTLRLRLEGDSLQIPVRLRPLLDVQPVKRGTKFSAARLLIGRLVAPTLEEEDDDEGPALHAAYETRELHLVIDLPVHPASNAVLQLGLAAEGADQHAEVRIENLLVRPELTAARGTTPAQIRGWRCSKEEATDGGNSSCHIAIPADSLGLSTFEPNTRLLLAARYLEPPPVTWALPFVLEWGGGLDGSRSTAGYHWIRLANSPNGK